MPEPQYLDTLQGRAGLPIIRFSGREPGVVPRRLRSDMTGTKAVHLEEWARRSGRAFLRFDYSGHGASSGTFTEGCIGDWAEDAEAAITGLTEGPVVLVGSSMGGWISLLMARRMPGSWRARDHRRGAGLHRGRDVGRMVRGPARNA
jgi:predicted alpha/beta hydrolase